MYQKFLLPFIFLSAFIMCDLFNFAMQSHHISRKYNISTCYKYYITRYDYNAKLILCSDWVDLDKDNKCVSSHCEEVEGRWEQATSQNGGLLRAHCEGWKKYREAKGEADRQEGRHRGLEKRNEKISLRIGCIHVREPGCAPCPVSRRGRSRGGDCDVGGSSRIDRVWVATNPRLSSLPLRFVDPFLLFSPLFYALSAFLSSSSIPLSSFHLAFFVSLLCFFLLQLWHSFILPSFFPSCFLLIMPL